MSLPNARGEALRTDVPVRHLAFSPDGTMLAGAAGSTVELWKTDMDPVSLGLSLPHAGAVHALSFTPDGTRLVTGCSTPDGGRLHVWEIPRPPDSTREMELRTWITTAVRRDELGRIQKIPWPELLGLEEELRLVRGRSAGSAIKTDVRE